MSVSRAQAKAVTHAIARTRRRLPKHHLSLMPVSMRRRAPLCTRCAFCSQSLQPTHLLAPPLQRCRALAPAPLACNRKSKPHHPPARSTHLGSWSAAIGLRHGLGGCPLGPQHVSAVPAPGGLPQRARAAAPGTPAACYSANEHEAGIILSPVHEARVAGWRKAGYCPEVLWSEARLGEVIPQTA